MNEKMQTLKARGEELVSQGNQRHLVVRNKNGQQYFQTSLTVAAGVGAVLLITGVSIPLMLVGGAVAAVAGVRVDYINNNL